MSRKIQNELIIFSGVGIILIDCFVGVAAYLVCVMQDLHRANSAGPFSSGVKPGSTTAERD